jgi:hypothetical protein
LYFEDLKHGTNPAEKGGRPKDIFELASIYISESVPHKSRHFWFAPLMKTVT